MKLNCNLKKDEIHGSRFYLRLYLLKVLHTLFMFLLECRNISGVSAGVLAQFKLLSFILAVWEELVKFSGGGQHLHITKANVNAVFFIQQEKVQT